MKWRSRWKYLWNKLENFKIHISTLNWLKVSITVLPFNLLGQFRLWFRKKLELPCSSFGLFLSLFQNSFAFGLVDNSIHCALPNLLRRPLIIVAETSRLSTNVSLWYGLNPKVLYWKLLCIYGQMQVLK